MMRTATLLILALVLISNSDAQESPPKVVQLMPADTVVSWTFWPKATGKDELLNLAPLEVISAASLQTFGVDLTHVERIDVLYGAPENAQGGGSIGAVVVLDTPFDLAQLDDELLAREPEKRGDRVLYELRALRSLRVESLDERTLLVGTHDYLDRMHARERNQRLGNLLAAVTTPQDALVFLDLASLRPVVEQAYLGPLGMLPEDVGTHAKNLVENVEIVALRLMLEGEGSAHLVATTASELMAEDVGRSLSVILNFAKQTMITQYMQQARGQGKLNAAIGAYLQRVGDTLVEKLQPKIAGNRVVVELDDLHNTIGVGALSAWLVPALRSAQLQSKSAESVNNLKQLGLALHNFASAYGKLPATAAMDDDGKPMLSWRVAILPFIEEAELYNQFNLDEPWDSEHNLTLLDRMPEVFKHPTLDLKAGLTVYQALQGKETLLRIDEPTDFREITDGTSNTAMAVEVTQDRAVPWTAPQDYEVDKAEPGEGLFGGDVSYFLFGDGSAQTISKNIDANVLQALFTRAGGEVAPR